MDEIPGRMRTLVGFLTDWTPPVYVKPETKEECDERGLDEAD
jgi:hypothetical protein